VQLPTVCEPAAQGFVVEVQLAPDSETDPLAHVAVAEPEKPGAVLGTEAVPPCARAPTEKLHEPLTRVVAVQPSAAQLGVL
jgi:hypothetical protein